MKLSVPFTALLGLAILFTGCGQNPSTPTALVESRAIVETVQVSTPDAPGGQVQALASGQLADSCSRLGEPVISRGSGLIAVILPAYRGATAQDCGGPQPFEEQISLGSDLPPGRYTVSVNGVEASFQLAESAAATATPSAPPENTPTQTPTEPPEPTPTEPPAEEPTPEATPTAADPEIPQASADCEVKGAFYADVTVPDGTSFDPGERFTKTWRVKNAGTCDWEGYTLVFQRGDQLGSQGPQPVPGTVEAGETVDISIDFSAPQTPGSYFSDWLFSTANGDLFGLGNPPIGLLWLKIGVRTPHGEDSGADEEPSGQDGTQPDAACAYQPNPSYEAQVLALINAARQEQGLSSLALLDPLSAAARGHSADMACHDFVEHYGYDGSTWQGRIKAQGVSFRSASENIYAGNPDFGGTPQGAVNWWMNSQIHRENILNPKAKQIGIGYAFYAGSTYKGYYTLNFVEP